ncbi:hypothetical protein [Saccharopolyspora sp. CA-218241]|uniref:hypothetical protein n=1 Tax=Saccharopolyspora sp. CA-218241 TaxID=3240027 RepID=UPI003D9577B9
MTTLAEPVGRHRLNCEPDGYVTAWRGDLNPDLPTSILPAAVPDRPADGGHANPSLELLRAVLDGLLRL